jgi:hypothetical protein
MRWLAIAVLAFSSLSLADGINMRGAGNLTCQQWSEQRASSEYFSAANWALGFLSGVAWDSGKDLLQDADSDRLLRAIDNYCSEHPSDSLSDATVALAYHLLESRPAP